MRTAIPQMTVIALLSLGASAPALASANATVTVGGSEQQISGSWDAGNITIAFNGFMETAYFGQYSTSASVASTFGAKFSNDYVSSGLCAIASGSVITFHLKGTAAFGPLSVSGPTTSFQLSATSGWPSQVSVADTGTIQLTVNGVVAATTKYDEGSTPDTISAGLVKGIQANSPVTLTETEGALFMESKATGAGTDYSYTLETTSWDSANFSEPSFLSPPVSGNLSGGANASSGGGTVYSYSIPTGSYDGVGNIVGFVDSVMGTWGFGYDPLNRLTGAAAGNDAPAGLANDYGCWTYDAFGNRDNESMSTTQCANNPPLLSWADNNTNNSNQFTSTSQAPGGVSYDAAGDLTYDGVNTYLYDGEGRVCAVKSQPIPDTYTMTGYVYDAEGNRVSKGTITSMSCDPSVNGYQATNDYVRGPGGEQLTETGSDGQGNMVWAHTNVYAGGQLMATYNPDGLHFHLTDWTGTRRVETDYEGVVQQTCASLPYGDDASCFQGPTEQLYAGLERDDESGLDHAMYRQYASAMGRWISPDPYNGSYDLEDPQSLNRYAYVNGNPMGAVDPSGLSIYSTACTIIPTFMLSSQGSFASSVNDITKLVGYANQLAKGSCVGALEQLGEFAGKQALAFALSDAVQSGSRWTSVQSFAAYIQVAIAIGCSIDYNKTACGSPELAWLIPGGNGVVGKVTGDALELGAAVCMAGGISDVACDAFILYELANKIYGFLYNLFGWGPAQFKGSLEPRPAVHSQTNLLHALGVPINGSNIRNNSGPYSTIAIPSPLPPAVTNPGVGASQN